MKYIWLILKLITASLYVFLVVFGSGFVGSSIANAINLETLNLNYSLIAKDSAVYAFFATGATLVVPPVLYVEVYRLEDSLLLPWILKGSQLAKHRLFFRYSASSSIILKSTEAKSPTGLTAGL